MLNVSHCVGFSMTETVCQLKQGYPFFLKIIGFINVFGKTGQELDSVVVLVCMALDFLAYMEKDGGFFSELDREVYHSCSAGGGSERAEKTS